MASYTYIQQWSCARLPSVITLRSVFALRSALFPDQEANR